MTEAEWAVCQESEKMLEYLAGRASDRKLRLFACACCFEVWYLLRDKNSKKAATTSERYAEGLLAAPRMAGLHEAAGQAITEWATFPQAAAGRPFSEELAHAVTSPEAVTAAVGAAEIAASWSEADAREIGYAARRRSQAALLRCIAGNPFKPISIAPAVLAWQQGTVVRMATVIYEEWKWEDMPLLGDALEEAGVTDQAVLDHCRGKGPHARGCHVVDAILGKS